MKVMKNIDLKPLLKSSSSYSLYYSIYSSYKLGLFKLLNKKNYTIKELSELLDIDTKGFLNLIDILKQLNIVFEKNEQLFLNDFITKDVIESIELWLESSNDFIKIWKNLRDKLKRNSIKQTNKQFWDLLYSSENKLYKYSKAFEWISKYTGQRLSQVMPLKNEKVIDIGCGTGMLLFEYLKDSNSIGTGLDLKYVEPYFIKNLTKYNLKNKVKFISQDFLLLNLKEKYDIIILSWIIHDLNDKNVITLLQNIKPILNPNGKLIIIESIIEDNEIYIETSSLEMYLSLGEGKERNLSNFKYLLNNNHFFIENIYDNYDYRKIIIASQYKINIENKFIYNFYDKLRTVPTFIVTQFSSNNSEDVDIAIILHQSATFNECILSIIKVVKSLIELDINGMIYPSLEFKSFLKNNFYYKSKHILFYASPWIFDKMESPGIKKAILSKINIEYQKPEDIDYIINYFDLIQKVTNSFILLLNKDFKNKKYAEKHAYLIAKYVKRWAPVKLPKLDPEKDEMTMDEVINFYSEIL